MTPDDRNTVSAQTTADAGRTIEVTWYNSTIDAAGSYLTRDYSAAIGHAVKCLKQWMSVEIRDYASGLPIRPDGRPSIAVLATLKALGANDIVLTPDKEPELPLGVSIGAVWSAVAQGYAQWINPTGYSRVVLLTDAGRAALAAAKGAK